MEFLVVVGLVLLNGFFAMSELAVVSARKIRLQQMAAQGQSGALKALGLAERPGPFLSTIQVGITTIGIFSGAFGEASFVSTLAPVLERIPLLAPFAGELALAIVVVAITYATLILGELVPKHLALHHREAIAVRISRPMVWLSRATAPFVWFLGVSTEAVLKLLGVKAKPEPPVTEEEIRALMKQGMEAGVFEVEEHAFVSRILRLDERRVPSIMTPRPDVDVLDLEEDLAVNLERIRQTRHKRYPVTRGGLESVEGVVDSTDLLERCLSGAPLDLVATVRPALFVPESVTVIELLELFKGGRAEMALVVDEFGEIEGLVTLGDVLEAVVGEMPSEREEADAVVEREDGSWLIDGSVSLDRLREVLNSSSLFPGEVEEGYHTVAGLVMTGLGRLPQVSDHFVWDGLRFEVVDMDRRRVDRVLLSRVPERAAGGSPSEQETDTGTPDE